MDRLKRLFTFQGRADRSEFWKANLIVLGIGIILQVLALGLFIDISASAQTYFEGTLSVFTAVTTLPLLALGARRLHDIGKSGWWQLIMLTGIGVIPLTIWFLRDGDPKQNIYGPPQHSTV